jgi:hypothetical protein
MCIGHGGSCAVLEKRRSALVNTKLNVGLGSKRRIGCHSNVERLAKFDEGFLGEVWVQLNLQHLRLVLGIPKNVEN